MSDLKNAWKKSAKSLILAANDLGEAVIDSVKVGREKLIAWAQTKDEPIKSNVNTVEADGTEIPTENNEESTEATP